MRCDFVWIVTRVLAIAFLLLLPPIVQAGIVVNIGGTQYGFSFPTDPAPVPGQIITPITSTGSLNQLVLGPGTYSVSNATGLPGANPDFDAWRYNLGNNWVWNFVISDNATSKVLLYGEAGGIQTTRSAIANQASVQNFTSSFTLPATTTVNFMIRDYYLPDNFGGVSLLVEGGNQSVPEPGSLAIMLGGLSSLGICLWRRKRMPNAA